MMNPLGRERGTEGQSVIKSIINDGSEQRRRHSHGSLYVGEQTMSRKLKGDIVIGYLKRGKERLSLERSAYNSIVSSLSPPQLWCII